MHKILLLLLSFCLITPCFSQSEKEKLSGIFKAIEKSESADKAMQSFDRGRHPQVDFEVVSEETFKKKKESISAFINQLQGIDETQLDRRDQINKEVMLFRLNDHLSDIEYRMYLIPINAEGGFYNEMSFILGRLPFSTLEDYQNYLRWLPKFSDWLKDHQQMMKEGLQAGIIAPKVVVLNNLKLLENWNDSNPEKSPFFSPLLSLPEDLSVDQKNELTNKAKKVIGEFIVPFYQNFTSFLMNDYLPKAPEKPGISLLPNGEEYYKDRIRFYSTFNITPDSVHLLGLAEVARIKIQMEKILRDLEFKGSFDDFLNFLRTDKQFYVQSPQELLNYAAWLSKKAEAGLPRLFKKLYSLPFTVEPVPDDIAPTYTAGRYVPGSWRQQRAGIYWVNTHFLESRPLYTLPALTLHEAVPGHHLQGSLAGELEDMPSFRNNYYISAFGEGWGLYSEYLGEEMGMYTTPYELFGRYTYEMWRACRLVVDTGIHFKGWSRDQAVEFMQSNTALSIHEVNTEIDRYIGWPGQAVSYKMGEIKIKSLREYASNTLGDKFDIREFHYHILKNGSVPLNILGEEIEAYVEEATKSR